MIDFVVMRAEQRVVCRDVQVMMGANCWTDHKLVRAKLKVAIPHSSKRKDIVSLLLPSINKKPLPSGINTVKCWSSICWLNHSEMEIPPVHLGCSNVLYCISSRESSW